MIHTLRTRSTLAASSACLLLTLLVAACGDDAGEPAIDAGSDAATDAQSDVTPDGSDEPDTTPEPDVPPDTTPDVPDDTTPDVPEDVTPDVPDVDLDAADGSGDPDAADVPDVEEPPPPPVAESCVEASDCTLPYTCIDDFCRLAIQSRGFVEDDFAIEQPEEVARLFDLLKALAIDVKFLAIDTEATRNEDGSVDAMYGAANVIVEGDPVQVRRQAFANGPYPIVFRPATTDDGPGDGMTWRTDSFQLQLSAQVTISFGPSGTFSGLIGFDAEEIVVEITLSPTAATATGYARGYVTRDEALARIMTADEDFPGFAALFCPGDRAYRPEDGNWKLADVLDCNGAVMDHDLDGDGEDDSYYTVIRLTFLPAIFVP